jgi:predicted nucleotidyltransferase
MIRLDEIYASVTLEDILHHLQVKGIRPAYLSISGSHLWHLNRPDSDLDIRGVYIKPTEEVIGLHEGRDTYEEIGILDGNVDIQLYEIKKVFRMLYNSNGNVVEMLLAPTCFYVDPHTVPMDWEELARMFLTRRLSHYYAGYFQSQRKRAMHNRGSKALVYSYREIMSGVMLMRSSEIIFDFGELRQRFEDTFFKLPLLDEYMDREKWKQPMADTAIWAFEKEWERLVELLKEEKETSSLPVEPDLKSAYKVLNDVLLETRYRGMMLSIGEEDEATIPGYPSTT